MSLAVYTRPAGTLASPSTASASAIAELAVIGENTPWEPLEAIVCDIDQLVLVTPAGHELTQTSPAAFERVLDYDFVTLGRTASLTRRISAAAEATGRSLRIRARARSFDATCRMVAAGLGLTILPRAGTSMYASALGLQITPLQGLDLQRRLLLVMRSRAALSPAASKLVDMIEARAPKLVAIG